jgi:hypothetical protein
MGIPKAHNKIQPIAPFSSLKIFITFSFLDGASPVVGFNPSFLVEPDHSSEVLSSG